MRAKKSLGQNFLKSKKVSKEIVKAAEIKKEQVVVEIGPGKGILTRNLLEEGARVVAVEKDERLVRLLKSDFERLDRERIKIIEGDIRDFKIQELVGDNSYKLVANIPYYITGEVLKTFLSSDNKPEKIVLLVQNEVADRIVARDKKESILSISVKVFGRPKKVSKVSRKAFKPSPSVDSAILLIENIKNPFPEKSDEKNFFKVLKAGFKHKRKKLFKNLVLDFKKEDVKNAFQTLGLENNIRAEEVGVKAWILLSKYLKSRL